MTLWFPKLFALDVHRGFPLDLIVRSPSQMAERIALGDSFLAEISERGRVLYAATDV